MSEPNTQTNQTSDEQSNIQESEQEQLNQSEPATEAQEQPEQQQQQTSVESVEEPTTESQQPTQNESEQPGSAEDESKKIKYDPNKLFIGGINKSTTDDGFYYFFEKFGTLTDHVVMRDVNKISRGFGFVTYENPSECENALNSKAVLDGHQLDIKRARLREEGFTDTHATKIYVQGLSTDTTEESFREYFLQFGEISDVTLIRNQSDQSVRGFGFVTFENSESVSKAVAKAEHLLNGKKLNVEIAQSSKKMRSQMRSKQMNNRPGGAGFRQNFNRNNLRQAPMQGFYGGGNDMYYGGRPSPYDFYDSSRMDYFGAGGRNGSGGAGNRSMQYQYGPDGRPMTYRNYQQPPASNGFGNRNFGKPSRPRRY